MSGASAGGEFPGSCQSDRIFSNLNLLLLSLTVIKLGVFEKYRDLQ